MSSLLFPSITTSGTSCWGALLLPFEWVTLHQQAVGSSSCFERQMEPLGTDRRWRSPKASFFGDHSSGILAQTSVTFGWYIAITNSNDNPVSVQTGRITTRTSVSACDLANLFICVTQVNADESIIYYPYV